MAVVGHTYATLRHAAKPSVGERGSSGNSQNLHSILSSGMFEARTPFTQARDKVEGGAARGSRKVVCFTETALEHIGLLAEEIEGWPGCWQSKLLSDLECR